MPPVSSKGKGKSQPRDGRRSRSRNSTPISGVPAIPGAVDTASYFQTPLAALYPRNVTIEEILDGSGGLANIPSSVSLKHMHEAIQKQFLAHIRQRGEVTDRVLREHNKKKKDRLEQERERDREKASREEERRLKLKKPSKKREPEADRPLAVGAHSLARQDGVDVHKDQSSALSSPVSPAPLSAGLAAQPESPGASDASHQPALAPAVQHYQPFGPDPSKFPDETIYCIREVVPDMQDEKKKEIYCVAEYPQSDLHELTCGTPPDRDFSSAKPQTQVSATTFAGYVEPFIRPLTEEDLAFLKERGDRVVVFQIPTKGKRHYKEIWAEEDGAMVLDGHHKPSNNEPRGSMDDMNDDVAETDQISTGPVLARLLSVIRPEQRSLEANGEMNGLANGDADAEGEVNGAHASSQPLPVATHIAESNQPNWKVPPPGKTDYASLEERILQELRHIGFLGDEDKPQYESHEDDEVAARLRLLQQELKKVSTVNGARKARIRELCEERMAQQEYNTIADDLDSQLNQAYLKRHRNIGKSKKGSKRPGGAGGGSHPVSGVGVSKPVVGEQIRSLMERKAHWNNIIGPVVNFGKSTIPTETTFDDESMERLMSKEEENWYENEE